MMDRVNAATHIKRAKSDYLEDILGNAFGVLDHGFVRVIDYMGDDLAIEQAARMSYGEGTRKTSETQGLLNYLMSHGHTSPYEMCELKLHIKLPIFVMRQLVRQRTASLNEYSARYSVLKDEFYLPTLEDLQRQSKVNNQGRSERLPDEVGRWVQSALNAHSEQSYEFYTRLLDEEVDLARELARMSLPINFYTEIYWKIDINNLFKFLRQRTDSHAQMEIRVYANLIEEIVRKWLPLSYNAYATYMRDAIAFSGVEVPLIRWALTSGVNIDPAVKPEFASKLSNREWKSFCDKIQRIK